MTSLKSLQSEITNQTDQISLDKGVTYDMNDGQDPDFLVKKVSPFQSIETNQIHPGRSSMVIQNPSKPLDDDVSEPSELILKPQDSLNEQSQREIVDADNKISNQKQQELTLDNQNITNSQYFKPDQQFHPKLSSNQKFGSQFQGMHNGEKAINETQIVKDNCTNMDLSSVIEPSEQTMFISEANVVPSSPKQAKTQQKLEVQNQPTKNPQDTPKKGDASNNNQSIQSANVKQRSNTKCEGTLKSARSISQEGTLSRLHGRPVAPSTSIAKRKMTTQQHQTSKSRLPNAPKGPTQSSAEARQYADKIQRFGDKYVLKQSQKRKNQFTQNSANDQKLQIQDKDNNVSNSDKNVLQKTRNKSKKQSILDNNSLSTQKDQFLKAQLRKILHSINSKKETSDLLGLGENPNNENQTAPEMTISINESIEPPSTENIGNDTQQVQQSFQTAKSFKNLSYQKTSLKVSAPPKMPPLRLSSIQKNSFVKTEFAKTTKASIKSKNFKKAIDTDSPINIENVNTAKDSLMKDINKSYSTMQQPKISQKGFTSSFKNPVYPEHHQTTKGHRKLTKINDPYFCEEMHNKALALIEEKKQRIRRQTENIKSQTQEQYRQNFRKYPHQQTDRSRGPSSLPRNPVAFGSGNYNTDRGLHSHQNLTGRNGHRNFSQSPLSSHLANSNRKSPQDSQYFSDNKQQIQSQIAAMKKQVENKYERYMGEGIGSNERERIHQSKSGRADSHHKQTQDEYTLSTAPHTEQKDQKKSDRMSKSKSQTKLRKNTLIIGAQSSSQNTITTQNTSLNKDQNVQLRMKAKQQLTNNTQLSPSNNKKSQKHLLNQTEKNQRNKNFWIGLINEKKKNQTNDESETSLIRDSQNQQTRKGQQLQAVIQPNYKPIQRNKNVTETKNKGDDNKNDQNLVECSETIALNSELEVQNGNDLVQQNSCQDLRKDLMVKVELVGLSIDKLESPIVRTNSQHKLTKQ